MQIEGLLPTPGLELEGGKVSILSMCGAPPHAREQMDLQKMPFDYRGGHIFRLGFDDDNHEDFWDAVIITGEGGRCYYSVNDPPWRADETHFVAISWDADVIVLEIDDDFRCEKPANGDVFDPAEAIFVLGNRCEYYPQQHAPARFRNLRMWTSRDPTRLPLDAGMPDTAVPDAGPQDSGRGDTGTAQPDSAIDSAATDTSVNTDTGSEARGGSDGGCAIGRTRRAAWPLVLVLCLWAIRRREG
jgi:hypothetical protein